MKTISSRNYAEQATTTASTFHCDICDRQYSHKVNLVIHMKCHQTSPRAKTLTSKPTIGNSVGKRKRRARKFVCSICNEIFCRARDLVRHSKNVHPEQMDDNIPKLDRDPIEWMCDVRMRFFDFSLRSTKLLLTFRFAAKFISRSTRCSTIRMGITLM